MIPLEEMLIEFLEYLKTTRREHYTCEDSYYDCPKSLADILDEEDSEEEIEQANNAECMCGADKYNVKLDEQIAKLEKLIQIIK